MTQYAYITPEILSWARIRASMDIETLSHKLNKKIEHLQQWENGEQKPTLKQAKKVAQLLHIPFGYLFLKQPPVEELPLPDLRTIADMGLHTISNEFRDLLNDIKRKQQWYREFVIENGIEEFAYLGQAKLGDDVDKVAKEIRDKIKVTPDARKKCGNQDGYFKWLTNNIEDLGVLVMRNSVPKSSDRG